MKTKTDCSNHAIIMLVGVFTACKNVDDPEQPSVIVDDTEEATTEEQTPKLSVLQYSRSTGMQMSYLMHEVNGGTTTYKNNYSFVVESAPDVVNSAILSGELILPPFLQTLLPHF